MRKVFKTCEERISFFEAPVPLYQLLNDEEARINETMMELKKAFIEAGVAEERIHATITATEDESWTSRWR